MVGGFIVIQMSGAMLGNIIFKKLTPAYKKIMLLSYIVAITAYSLLFISHNTLIYFITFFLLGIAIDGFRLASMNLLFAIAPQEKRPIYVALQNNLTSIGLFFAIPGGVIVHYFGYEVLYGWTIFCLALGLFFATRIKYA